MESRGYDRKLERKIRKEGEEARTLFAGGTLGGVLTSRKVRKALTRSAKKMESLGIDLMDFVHSAEHAREREEQNQISWTGVDTDETFDFTFSEQRAMFHVASVSANKEVAAASATAANRREVPRAASPVQGADSLTRRAAMLSPLRRGAEEDFYEPPLSPKSAIKKRRTALLHVHVRRLTDEGLRSSSDEEEEDPEDSLALEMLEHLPRLTRHYHTHASAGQLDEARRNQTAGANLGSMKEGAMRSMESRSGGPRRPKTTQRGKRHLLQAQGGSQSPDETLRAVKWTVASLEQFEHDERTRARQEADPRVVLSPRSPKAADDRLLELFLARDRNDLDRL